MIFKTAVEPLKMALKHGNIKWMRILNDNIDIVIVLSIYLSSLVSFLSWQTWQTVPHGVKPMSVCVTDTLHSACWIPMVYSTRTSFPWGQGTAQQPYHVALTSESSTLVGIQHVIISSMHGWIQASLFGDWPKSCALTKFDGLLVMMSEKNFMR